MVLQMGGPSSSCMTANTRQNFLPRQRTSFTFITEGVTSDKRHCVQSKSTSVISPKRVRDGI